MNRKSFFILASATLTAALAFAPSMCAAQSTELTGAGSTFVYPIMARWAADFKAAHPAIAINYQSIGSGAGIQQIRNNTVDFGASDASLSDAQLRQMPAVIQIPESAGPVCITYNLPISQPLHLTGDALAGIFLGTITRWTDPRITQSNPGVQLPNKPILVAHRSDGSGTTSIFTTYLAAVSPEWKAKVGSGIAVNWPVGLGGKGSEGVTGVVKQTQGAIGYVELTYATGNHLPVAWMRNAAGQYVAPSTSGTSAAIAAFKTELARDVRSPIVNAPGAAAYPISGFTFLILPKDGANLAKRQALKSFVNYILTAGQKSAAAMAYAPLPPAIQKLDLHLAGEMLAAGRPLH